ncbi:uncharacterized protein BDV17DRAFT_286260 [Aspergillus undulatus]|uniref:uncharacterized protein n=1 Tax=Aspergillus undulatus TaxID=1810928 RepID=UPI003CCDE549
MCSSTTTTEVSNQPDSRCPNDPGQDLTTTEANLARTERLRRHGLDVSDDQPNKVLLLDILHNPEDTATTLDIVEAILDVVSRRLITKEFCNSHAPLRAGHDRVSIMLLLEDEIQTPFEIYRDLHTRLVYMQDVLREEVVSGVALTSNEKHPQFGWAECVDGPSAKVWLSSALMNRFRPRSKEVSS